MEKTTRGGFSADELACQPSFATAEGDALYETETQRVLRTLHDMAEQGLLSKETSLSAFIRYKVSSSALLHFQRICALERDFLALLQEMAPNADAEESLELDLRQVNQCLIGVCRQLAPCAEAHPARPWPVMVRAWLARWDPFV